MAEVVAIRIRRICEDVHEEIKEVTMRTNLQGKK